MVFSWTVMDIPDFFPFFAWIFQNVIPIVYASLTCQVLKSLINTIVSMYVKIVVSNFTLPFQPELH